MSSRPSTERAETSTLCGVDGSLDEGCIPLVGLVSVVTRDGIGSDI